MPELGPCSPHFRSAPGSLAGCARGAVKGPSRQGTEMGLGPSAWLLSCEGPHEHFSAPAAAEDSSWQHWQKQPVPLPQRSCAPSSEVWAGAPAPLSLEGSVTPASSLCPSILGWWLLPRWLLPGSSESSLGSFSYLVNSFMPS